MKRVMLTTKKARKRVKEAAKASEIAVRPHRKRQEDARKYFAVPMLILMLVVLLLSGCTEPGRYGNGDPSPEYIAMFGNDSGARLNFTQEQRIDKLLREVYGVNQQNPDGSITHTPGLLGRTVVLEAEVLAMMKKPAVPDPAVIDWLHNPLPQDLTDKVNEIIDRLNGAEVVE